MPTTRHRESMYRGMVKFDREQLVFIAESAMMAAFDRIHTALPPVMEPEEYEKQIDSIGNYIMGAEAVVSLFLPILFAQLHIGILDDPGMGQCDFAGWSEFEKACNDYQQAALQDTNKEPEWPDFRAIAEKFVDYEFAYYLGKANDANR